MDWLRRGKFRYGCGSGFENILSGFGKGWCGFDTEWAMVLQRFHKGLVGFWSRAGGGLVSSAMLWAGFGKVSARLR